METKTVNLEEILLNCNFSSLEILKRVYCADGKNGSMYDRLMDGMKEACKQTLELAAENATTHKVQKGGSYHGTLFVPDYCINVDKQSILNTIKQVK